VSRLASPYGLVLVVLLALSCEATDRANAPPPLPGETISSFLAVGDTGEPAFLPALRSGQRAVARGMALEDARAEVDAVVLLGDNFYPDGLREASLVEQVRDYLVLPYCRFLRLDGPRSAEVASACPGGATATRRPFFAVLGNHDYGDPVSPGLQHDAVSAFAPGFDLPPGVASLRALGEGLDLVLVDSELLMDGADPAPLRDALRASAGPWRVLALHRPVALANGQQTNPAGGEMKLRETIRAAVAEAGVRVQLTLAGHTHDMQVLVEPDPMPLHVVAGSGSTMRNAKPGTESRRFVRKAVGFARIDRVRTPEGERLVATLFATPRYPALQGTLEAPLRAVARYSVDLEGTVRDELATTPAR